MIAPKLRAAAVAVCATLGLGACSTYDDGYGYGRSAYSVGLGYGGGYYDDYYGGGYGPGYGWYDGFYYPGSGYYVFDRGGRRHAWNDRQRDYWRNRGGDGGRGDGPRRPAWEGNNGANLTPEARQAQREAWQARRQQQGMTADPERAARREAWRAQRQQQMGQQQGATTSSQPRTERSFRGGEGGGNPAWRGGGRRSRGN